MQHHPESTGGPACPTRWFDIRPNPPESGWVLCGFFGACAVASLGAALYLYFMGLPLVLPFSGLELAALGVALWYTWRAAQRRELVSISEERVTVERIPAKGDGCCWSSPRYWTQVVLQPPVHTGHDRLLLRYCGRELELGRCLGDADRSSLAKALSRALAYGGRAS